LSEEWEVSDGAAAMRGLRVRIDRWCRRPGAMPGVGRVLRTAVGEAFGSVRVEVEVAGV